jgi:hypothetical protein
VQSTSQGLLSECGYTGTNTAECLLPISRRGGFCFQGEWSGQQPEENTRNICDAVVTSVLCPSHSSGSRHVASARTVIAWTVHVGFLRDKVVLRGRGF